MNAGAAPRGLGDLQARLNDRAPARGLVQLAARMNARRVDGRSSTATTTASAPATIVQRKEPYDSAAREAWDSAVESIIQWVSTEELEELTYEEVDGYLEKLGLPNPHRKGFSLPSQGALERFENLVGSVRWEQVWAFYEDEQDEGSEYDSSELSDEELEELHYSSEDDEVPEGRREFDRTVGVIRRLGSGVDDLLESSPRLEHYQDRIGQVVTNITDYREKNPKKSFPAKFNPVRVEDAEDWLAFAQAIREAKSTDNKADQKPTVYDLRFQAWDDAKFDRVGFRGRMLRDPRGGSGRSWPEIALALHRLAGRVGRALGDYLEPQEARRAGDRVLATAMLEIFAGRGNDVLEELVELGVSDRLLDDFEATVLEFFALAGGVETVRLPIALVDTLFNLSNIAQGATFGAKGRRYDFLNVFSSVREFEDGPEHVFVPGVYGKNRKEETRYGGFHRAPLSESTQKPKGSSVEKSKKSVGKSLFTHSAGHGRVEKLLQGDRGVTDELWKQVRPVEVSKRRETHAGRLFQMGPIRLYNLVENLRRRHADELEGLSEKEVADLILDVLESYVTGAEPEADNPFRQELPTGAAPSFATALSRILEDEEIEEPPKFLEGELREILATGYGEEVLARLYRHDPTGVRRTAIRLVRRQYRLAGSSALHLAVATGEPRLVRDFLAAGPKLDAEDKKGETPLALALRLGNEAIIRLLVEAQDERTGDEELAVPKAWRRLKAPKKGDRRWLRDDEVRTGLLAENLAHTHVAPAVDVANHPEALAGFIRDNFLQQMGQGGVLPFTVVPLNFRNAHWANLVIEQNPARRSQPNVYFFDSLGASEEKLRLVREVLRMTGVYTRTENLHDLSEHLQQDGFTCGTWLIRAASTIVNRIQAGDTLPQVQHALRGLQPVIRTLHEQQVELVRGGGGGKKKETGTVDPTVDPKKGDDDAVDL